MSARETELINLYQRVWTASKIVHLPWRHRISVSVLSGMCKKWAFYAALLHIRWNQGLHSKWGSLLWRWRICFRVPLTHWVLGRGKQTVWLAFIIAHLPFSSLLPHGDRNYCPLGSKNEREIINRSGCGTLKEQPARWTECWPLLD